MSWEQSATAYSKGATRAIYMLPLIAVMSAGTGLGFMLFRWRKNDKNRALAKADVKATDSGKTKKVDDYDAKLDEELKDLDDAE